jgi:hypothetical protein
MANYLDNLKLIILGQIESNTKQNVSNPKTELEFDLAYDSESEFENVYTVNEPLKIDMEKINMEKINMEKINIEEIKKEYGKIHIELVKKELLVRERLNSDTIEQIKLNCKEYVNDDIKIIKDFAIVMESFNHIKDKLIEFESGMKEFESDIKIKTSNQDLSNSELDNRISMIDEKLNNTIGMIEQINSTSNEVMDKIVKLENIINIHSTQREELLSKLNKVELTKQDDFGFWNRCVNNLFGISNFNDGIFIKIFFGSTCIITTWYVFKYNLNKK